MGAHVSSDAFCYGCFDGLGQMKPAARRPRKGSNGSVGSATHRKASKPCAEKPSPSPSASSGRRWPWCCCRRRRPAEAAPGVAYSCADGISCPTLDELTTAQREALQEMKTRLVKLHVTKRHDLWMKRFLAHKKWNLEKAVTAYLEMEEWRRKVRADEILQDYPDGKLNSVLPADMTGFYPYSVDKKGRLVIWMRTGHVPWWRSLFERTDEALQAQLWAGEWIYAQQAHLARVTGVWRERAVVLVDLSHLDFNYFQGISSSTRARRRGTQQTTAQYYPGVVDKAYLLHAPSFASRAWNVLKFFLSEKLMEKAVLASSDEEIEGMLSELGAANVPRALGGTSDGPDLQLPEELMMSSSGRWQQVVDDWRPREVLVPAGAKHQETLEVTAGASVTWQWALVSSSINFQVDRVSLDGSCVSVVGCQQCSFNDLEEPIWGRVPGPSMGAEEVRFTWDNSDSRWSKKLLLRLTVAPGRLKGHPAD